MWASGGKIFFFFFFGCNKNINFVPWKRKKESKLIFHGAFPSKIIEKGLLTIDGGEQGAEKKSANVVQTNSLVST